MDQTKQNCRRPIIVDPFRILYGQYRVLCVDDDVDVLDVLSERMDDISLFTAQVAGTASAARASIERDWPQICLMDLGIADINGDELWLLRRYSSRVSFVVISGRREMTKAAEVMRLGACDVLDKPVDLYGARMHGALQRALDARLFHLPSGIKHGERLCGAFRALREHGPRTTREWARLVGAPDRRELRRWFEAMDMTAGGYLALYHLQKRALEQSFVMGTGGETMSFEEIRLARRYALSLLHQSPHNPRFYLSAEDRERGSSSCVKQR